MEESATKEKAPRKISATFASFKEELDKEENLEKKLKMTLDFMRESLSQSGSPRFRDFWEAKSLALSFFKENLNPAVRSLFWTEYTELIEEAQRLKILLDEQSAFAIEQIDLAINSIKEEWENAKQQIAPVEIHIPEESETISARKEYYITLQSEVHFLSTLASRLLSLRKEVINTEMRIRHKNALLEKISALGDEIIPKRKESIKKISDEFLSDAMQFSEKHFSIAEEKIITGSPHQLKEEIKALQAIAKILSLNSHAFKETRNILSNCWEVIKKEEKIRKKEFSEKKALYKENFNALMQKLEVLEKQEGISSEQLESMISEIKSSALGREENKKLNDQVKVLKKKIFQKAKEKKQILKEKEEEKEREKREKVFQRLVEILDRIEDINLESLLDFKEKFYKEVENFSFSESEKAELNQLLQRFEFHLLEKQEKKVLEEVTDEEVKYRQLEEILDAYEHLLSDAKQKMEDYRKESGKSGLDFEMAMTFREISDFQKDFIAHIEHAISRIDEQLSAFE